MPSNVFVVVLLFSLLVPFASCAYVPPSCNYYNSTDDNYYINGLNIYCNETDSCSGGTMEGCMVYCSGAGSCNGTAIEAFNSALECSGESSCNQATFFVPSSFSMKPLKCTGESSCKQISIIQEEGGPMMMPMSLYCKADHACSGVSVMLKSASITCEDKGACEALSAEMDENAYGVLSCTDGACSASAQGDRANIVGAFSTITCTGQDSCQLASMNIKQKKGTVSFSCADGACADAIIVGDVGSINCFSGGCVRASFVSSADQAMLTCSSDSPSWYPYGSCELASFSNLFSASCTNNSCKGAHFTGHNALAGCLFCGTSSDDSCGKAVNSDSVLQPCSFYGRECESGRMCPTPSTLSYDIKSEEIVLKVGDNFGSGTSLTASVASMKMDSFLELTADNKLVLKENSGGKEVDLSPLAGYVVPIAITVSKLVGDKKIKPKVSYGGPGARAGHLVTHPMVLESVSALLNSRVTRGTVSFDILKNGSVVYSASSAGSAYLSISNKAGYKLLGDLKIRFNPGDILTIDTKRRARFRTSKNNLASVVINTKTV